MEDGFEEKEKVEIKRSDKQELKENKKKDAKALLLIQQSHLQKDFSQE